MIGGSFAKALKDRNLASLYGIDRRQDELTLGVATGVIDVAAELAESTIKNMDIILLATPVRAMESVLLELKPFLSPHTLVTDVGSTKSSVINAAKAVFGFVPPNFIPGHPIAGAEKSGVLAANSNLFEKHKVILTPQADSDPVLLNTLHELWSSIGAEVLSMDVEHHDAVLANSSHLPHLLAYTLVDALANDKLNQDVFRFAAGGFRDFTRIASSDPTMWRDVFLANKGAVLGSLDNFIHHLQVIRGFVDQENGPAMFGVFSRAKSARDHFLRLQKKPDSLQSNKITSITVQPANVVRGEMVLAGGASLTQKLIFLAVLVKGVSELRNIDGSESTQVTLQALRDMGVVIENLSRGHIRIHGVGPQGLKAPIAPIDVHCSTLSLYALLPILMGQKFSTTLTASGLLQQPFTELVALMKMFNGSFETAQADCLPFVITPLRHHSNKQIVQLNLACIAKDLHLSVLLACIMSSQDVIAEINDSADDMAYFLKDFVRDDMLFKEQGKMYFSGERNLHPVNVGLPSDTVKSAWLVLLATILPGSNVRLQEVLFDLKNKRYLSRLSATGASIEVGEAKSDFIRNLTVSFAPLNGFTVPKEELLHFEDTLLFLCVAAVYAQGVSCFEGISSLPYVLQDQLSVLLEALEKQGIHVKRQHDVLEIEGGIPDGGELDCCGDYVLGLSMIALGVRARKSLVVRDCQGIFKEFEGFEAAVEQIGFHCNIASQ
ncbi:prephenate dehydrogenase/arogenate dehydrogenase family protein [Marinomonas agarivorans]|nr:prephenate dehydrogenase/arogenate dehydrogenase family protein [Marinomonas agarivorans]